MNHTDFSQVFAQIVKDMGYESNRLNGYGFAFSAPNFGVDSLGFTQNHFDEGWFWARDWFQGGADPSALRIEYPALLVEPGSLMSNPRENETHYTYTFLFCHNMNCVGCPKGFETEQGAMERLLSTARSFFFELMTVSKYILEKDAVQYTLYLSAGRFNHLIDNEGYTRIAGPSVSLYSAVINAETTFEKMIFAPSIVGWGVELTFYGSCSQEFEFDYSQVTFNPLALTVCCD